MDATGQFIRALPSKSLADKSRSCTGGKRSKERLTCALFVNASGGKERPISLESQQIPGASGALPIKQIYHVSTLINQKPGWKRRS